MCACACVSVCACERVPVRALADRRVAMRGFVVEWVPRVFGCVCGGAWGLVLWMTCGWVVVVGVRLASVADASAVSWALHPKRSLAAINALEWLGQARSQVRGAHPRRFSSFLVAREFGKSVTPHFGRRNWWPKVVKPLGKQTARLMSFMASYET